MDFQLPKTYIMKTALAFIFTLSLAASASAGYGASNLDIFGYPDLKAMKPMAPYDHSQMSFQSYRSEVEMYVQQAQQYVDAANNDIQEIREKQKKAIQNANQAVQEFNDWASQR